MNILPRLLASLIAALVLASASTAQSSLGLETKLVLDQPAASVGAFPLVRQGRAAPLYLDTGDYPGVLRAAADLQADIERVSGLKPELLTTGQPLGSAAVIAGTLGHSPLIDRLVKEHKLDVSAISGQWESFVIATVANPLPGLDSALVIAGSDKRGAIYGIYEISEQIGVSPWYWWADVPPVRHAELLIRPGAHIQGPPVVKYRGIFINDEEPALGSWSREKFGGINSRMYSHMFELLLRLRANYLWPAMWGTSFNEDDPENSRLADEYGIVMGTSHHEPMMRAHKDWTRRRKEIGNGKWNYATNTDGLREFFRQGIERAKGYENLVTIGMRGDGDEPMAGDDNMPANIALLEKVVADQRGILADLVNPDVTRVPQVWSLYKEVADYYENGMKVPDDVTLLWCDDNWGNLRRLPTQAERARAGGAGVYYHFDYVGSPRSYKWINTNPLPKIWEQMNLAAEYDATRVWIVNVGDLKPMELPIEFFLRMAWNPKAISKEGIAEWTRRWAEREFGADHAADIADLVSLYAKYNAWRKPELLAADTFSFVNYREADRVQAAWNELESSAIRIGAELPARYRDAYFQLVEYPVVASSTVARLHLATGRNRLYAAQGRVSAAEQAALVRDLFRHDQELTDAYHRAPDGKWNHMMDQTRIGYTTWSDPKANVLPELAEPAPVANQVFGVAVEGSKLAWPGPSESAALPPFDSVGRQHRWIDVFRRSAAEVSFTATANQPWVKLSPASGKLGPDQRIQVEIDWAAAPLGQHEAFVTIARSGGESVRIRIDALRSDQFPRTAKNTFFGALTGPVAIDAAAFSANTPAAGTHWEAIPDYGRGTAGMSIFPVTAASIELGAVSPTLEYPVLLSRTGEIPVEFITGVALNFLPGRGVRFAVSLDDQPPRVVDLFGGQTYADPTKRGDKSSPAIRSWHDWVRNNAVSVKSL
ncbi:MAG: hypothetical protein RIQ79_1038, partial [Verrucomicrobiota bacterium]